MMSPCSRPMIGFTYSSSDLNRFSLWRDMLHGFAEAGAGVLSLDCHQPLDGIAETVKKLDGLVVSGGVDVEPTRYGGDADDSLMRATDPVRDRNEEAAVAAALDAGIPILAICRGLQLVNTIFGGTLYVDLARDLGGDVRHEYKEEALAQPLHMVNVASGTLLSAWLGGVSGRIAVNSEHHQGVRRLASALAPVAVADDGLVEAVEIRERRVVGVQWHPEILWRNDDHALALLRGFVASCRVTEPPCPRGIGLGPRTIVSVAGA